MQKCSAGGAVGVGEGGAVGKEDPCHGWVAYDDDCPVERWPPAGVGVVDGGGMCGEEEFYDGIVAAVDGFVERGPAARVEYGWGGAMGQEV